LDRPLLKNIFVSSAFNVAFMHMYIHTKPFFSFALCTYFHCN
jgi:hypothetical protein